MGCGPSKPEASPPPPKSPYSNTAASTNSSLPQKTPARAPAAPSPPTHDTVSSASLVDSGGSNLAFHGLLTEDALSLSRSANPALSKVPRTPTPALSPAGLTRIEGIAMTMPYVILVPSDGPDEAALHRIVDPVFEHANSFLNAWNPNSEISALNKEKPAKQRPLSSSLAALFDVVDHAFELTDGRFDPTTGVISRAYENCIAEKGRPPLPAETTRYKHAVGWRRRLTRKPKAVARNNAHTIIDLDGISKGYVIDLIVAAMVAEGIEHCYVDWAGDIRAQGLHPSGRPWRSAVMAPPPLNKVFGHWKNNAMTALLHKNDYAFYADFAVHDSAAQSAKVEGVAIATSGDYFAIQKYGFHHIARLDTLSVMKAKHVSVASVCIAASTCAIADAVATAAMTFDRTDEAMAFLQQLVGAHPNTVYGYCVMDRTQNAVAPEMFDEKLFSASVFTPIVRSGSNSASESTSSSDEKGLTVAERRELVANIQYNTVTNCYRCTFNGTDFELDNFRGCSMQPEQIVSFVTAQDFFKKASFVENEAQNQISIELLVPRSSATSPSVSDERGTGMKLDLALKHICVVDGCAVVQAAVKKVDLGEVESVQSMYKDQFLTKREISLDVPRSKLPFYPLDKQTKSFLRQIPSMMWVVSTAPLHGGELAFTATSVTVPTAANGMIYFNIAHSSAFYAGLGGVGSTVKFFALSTKQKDLARRYVRNCNLEKEDAARLVSESLVSARCIVAHLEDVQDHQTVLSRIEEVVFPPKQGAETLIPLIWQHGDFATDQNL